MLPLSALRHAQKASIPLPLLCSLWQPMIEARELPSWEQELGTAQMIPTGGRPMQTTSSPLLKRFTLV